MLSRLCSIAFALLFSTSAWAQTRGEGSLTVSGGGYSNGISSGRVIQFGGGGLAIFDRRVGVGGDVLLSGGGGDAWLETSFRGEYRFISRATPSRVTPFIQGGYTLLGAVTELGGYNGVNFGGGVLYSLGREAIRVEGRDVVFSTGLRQTQYFTVRVSLTFR